MIVYAFIEIKYPKILTPKLISLVSLRFLVYDIHKKWFIEVSFIFHIYWSDVIYKTIIKD